jgi:hypothetical protein
MLGYFIMKVIQYGVISFLSDDVVTVKFQIVSQYLDMLFLGGTLFIFRSRVWPPFFSIGYEELAGVIFHAKQF